MGKLISMMFPMDLCVLSDMATIEVKARCCCQLASAHMLP